MELWQIALGLTVFILFIGAGYFFYYILISSPAPTFLPLSIQPTAAGDCPPGYSFRDGGCWLAGEGETCGGPEELLCQDGLVCVTENNVSTCVVDETKSPTIELDFYQLSTGCVTDSDCVSVPDLCGCSAGGRNYALSIYGGEIYEAWKHNQPEPICSQVFSSQPSCFSAPLCRQNTCVFNHFQKKCTMSHCLCECVPLGASMESKNNIECDVDCSGYNIVGCEWVEATQSCDTLTFTPEPEPDVDDNNTAYTITTLSDATTTTLPTQLTPIPPQPGFLGLDITQWTTLFYTLTIIIVFIVAAVAAFIFATRNN